MGTQECLKSRPFKFLKLSNAPAFHTFNSKAALNCDWLNYLTESQWSRLKSQVMAMLEPVVYIPLCLQLRIPEIGRSPCFDSVHMNSKTPVEC